MTNERCPRCESGDKDRYLNPCSIKGTHSTWHWHHDTDQRPTPDAEQAYIPPEPDATLEALSRIEQHLANIAELMLERKNERCAN